MKEIVSVQKEKIEALGFGFSNLEQNNSVLVNKIKNETGTIYANITDIESNINKQFGR